VGGEGAWVAGPVFFLFGFRATFRLTSAGESPRCADREGRRDDEWDAGDAPIARDVRRLALARLEDLEVPFDCAGAYGFAVPVAPPALPVSFDPPPPHEASTAISTSGTSAIGLVRVTFEAKRRGKTPAAWPPPPVKRVARAPIPHIWRRNRATTQSTFQKFAHAPRASAWAFA
jgi:hypothetical protein